MFKKSYFSGIKNLHHHRALFFTLLKHEIIFQYKNSILGIFWIVINPLCMLTIYYFIFGSIFKLRWDGDTNNKTFFILAIYLGIINFNFFSQTVNASSVLIARHASYVKKIVFPLEMLCAISVCNHLLVALVNFMIFLITYLIFIGPLPITALLAPIIFVPFLMLILGLSWIISSLSTYIRDIPQILNFLLSALLFTSPIFYPISAIPKNFQSLFLLNPIALEIEMQRGIFLQGEMPSLYTFMLYLACGLIVAFIGYKFFMNTKDGFADVL